MDKRGNISALTLNEKIIEIAEDLFTFSADIKKEVYAQPLNRLGMSVDLAEYADQLFLIGKTDTTQSTPAAERRVPENFKKVGTVGGLFDEVIIGENPDWPCNYHVYIAAPKEQS